MKPIQIILACPEHIDDIWRIFYHVIQTGDTYVYSPKTTREQMMSLWFGENYSTYVALIDGKVAGTYFIKPNYSGFGSHVANCSYMVDPTFRGQKVGKRMAEHSFQEAKTKGFLSMQYNIVVSTNTVAVELWKSLGFRIIGTSPKAFRHNQFGLVDTYIMHRDL
jgi:GNAT superfamily N-acetyltransferase